MIKATVMQKEEVLDCVDIVESHFVYQMNNTCHKRYTPFRIRSEIR